MDTCLMEGCEKPTQCRGVCGMHFARWKRGDTSVLVLPSRRVKKFCSIDGCDRHHAAKGYCLKHYGRLWKHGDVSVVKKRGHAPRPTCARGHDLSVTAQFRRDGSRHCGECTRQFHQEAIARSRSAYVIAKGNRCWDCGAEFMSRELHFHHRDPSEKLCKVADLIGAASLARLQTEIAKCDVLCRACHIVSEVTLNLGMVPLETATLQEVTNALVNLESQESVNYE